MNKEEEHSMMQILNLVGCTVKWLIVSSVFSLKIKRKCYLVELQKHCWYCMVSLLVGYGKISHYKRIVLSLSHLTNWISLDFYQNWLAWQTLLHHWSSQRRYWWMHKFGLELNPFNLEKIDHPLQSDFISCGVLICY